MTLAINRPDASTVKARQQKTWSSGDFSVVAARIVLVSELLADNADLRLRAGWRVLDVACGTGNATLAAARSGAHVVGVDYVPELLEDGRARAVTEGLDVEFRVGDAEDLPADDASFDAVLSVFGSMFAPDHQRTADEIVRVARPGAAIYGVNPLPGELNPMAQVVRLKGKILQTREIDTGEFVGYGSTHRRLGVVDSGRVYRRDVPGDHFARPGPARGALTDAVGHRTASVRVVR